MDEISIVIRAMVKSFQADPIEINDGDCDCFARAVVRRIPKAKAVWDEDLDPSKRWKMDHCFIMYQNRYYDAECPEGVDNWQELPFFLRSVPQSEFIGG